MEGKGQMIYKDGSSYNGDYLADRKDGYGVFVWKDGKRYEGN